MFSPLSFLILCIKILEKNILFEVVNRYKKQKKVSIGNFISIII
jgi:hypothetical protein